MVEEQIGVKEVEEGKYYVSLVDTMQRKKDGVIWIIRKRKKGLQTLVDYIYWEGDERMTGIAKEKDLLGSIIPTKSGGTTQEEKGSWVTP